MAYLSYSTSFDGTGDYLTVSNGLNFGTRDFTIEFWLNPDVQYADGSAIPIFSGEYNGSGLTWGIFFASYAGYNGLTFSYGQYGSYTVGKYVNGYWGTQGVWSHIVFQRRSGVIQCYINGQSQTLTTYNENGTFSDSVNLTGNNTTKDICNSYTGYLSNVRVLDGTGLYSGNFTPSTLPLDNVSNMILLTCRSATAIDFSINNYTITTVGSTTITNTNTPFTVASIVTPTTYNKQIPSVVSTTKQSTELTSLDSTSIQTSSLSIQVPNQKYIPGVSSTTKQTTELTSLDSTNNYSVTVSANLVGKKEIPTVPSVTRFSTFIKTSEDPIVDEAAGATINQTWTLS
jgi:hypothetical protein